MLRPSGRPSAAGDLDQDLLARAARVLGTKTKKDTVNEALRRVVQQEARRRHVDELASGALPDLGDPGDNGRSMAVAAIWPTRASGLG